MMNPSDRDWRYLLTPQERAQMLADIARVCLAVGRRRFPERSWDDLDIAAGSLATKKSPVERLLFIERALPALLQAVYQISQTPSVTFVTRTRQAAPPGRARRVEAKAVMEAARKGHAGRFLEERCPALSVDTPENRATKAFVSTLRRDADAIMRIAEAAGETDIAETAQQCAGRLQEVLRSPWWEAITAEEAAWHAPPTHRMLADVTYAQVCAWMRQYQRSFQFAWDNPLLTLPSRETWRLYEAWGLFRVIEALLALGYAPAMGTGGPSHELFAVRNDRLAFALVKGTESRVDLARPGDETLALYYNRTYPQRARSLSRTMQPDIALEQPTAGGYRTWVLDPKFKTYEATGTEHDDIDQMHAYRDAIVDCRHAGRKPVQRAWCLYAGPASGDSRPLITYGPPAASVVGAVRLRPGDADGFARLCGLLSGWLGAAEVI